MLSQFLQNINEYNDLVTFNEIFPLTRYHDFSYFWLKSEWTFDINQIISPENLYNFIWNYVKKNLISSIKSILSDKEALEWFWEYISV